MLKGKLLNQINSDQQPEVAPGLRGKGLTIGRHAAELTVFPFMVERSDSREDLVDAHISYLHTLDASRNGNSWQNFLSGETDASTVKDGATVSVKRSMHAAGVERDTSRPSIHITLKSPDYMALEATYSRDRYKFYHSIVNKKRGEAYLAEVLRRAYAGGVSLTAKTFDHSYDNPNLYTWHPTELAAIISEVYPEYMDAFGETEHFLQGPLAGVNQRHIGWVQEPITTVSSISHSGRMGRLGRELDRNGLSGRAYRDGCVAAGVRPEAPWLLRVIPAAET